MTTAASAREALPSPIPPGPGAAGALLASAHAGDPRALDRLIGGLYSDANRYARYACTATPGEAEDAAQDALLALARNLGAVRSSAGLRAWLATVVRRTCLRRARRAIARGERAFADEEADLLAGPGADPVRRIALAGAIAALPPPYRAAVILRDFEELTIAEVAARLGTTPGAAKVRLHRARALLRERLGP